METTPSSAIDQLIASLSPEVRDFVTEGGWLSVCQEIAHRNSLSGQNREMLIAEVLAAVADRELRERMRISLVESLRIPGILANDIAKEIEEKVFREVRLIEPPLLDEGNEHLLVPSSADTPAGAPGIAPEPSSTAAEPVAAAPSTAPETKKPLMPPLEKETPPEAVPPKSAVDAKLAELRQAAEKAATEKQYPGNDPYREPIA